MKTMRINQRKFWYCLHEGVEEITDTWGNATGDYRPIYGEPTEYKANVSAASGQSQVEQFGSLENYDKVIVTDDMDCPITETSVLFIDKEPETSLDGEPMYDYTVWRVAKSINSVSIAISKVNVS